MSIRSSRSRFITVRTQYVGSCAGGPLIDLKIGGQGFENAMKVTFLDASKRCGTFEVSCSLAYQVLTHFKFHLIRGAAAPPEESKSHRSSTREMRTLIPISCFNFLVSENAAYAEARGWW